jgi:hypothetical protein
MIALELDDLRYVMLSIQIRYFITKLVKNMQTFLERITFRNLIVTWITEILWNPKVY